MTDAQFRTELRIRAYIDQIDGYPLGHPKRATFNPLFPVCEGVHGKIERQKTLNMPVFAGFTADQRELLLAED